MILKDDYKTNKRNKGLWKSIFILGGVIGLNLVVLLSILWFSVTTQMRWPYAGEVTVTFETWQRVIGDPAFGLTLIHSAHVAVLTALVTLCLGMPAAIGISRMPEGLGKKMMELLFMAPLVMPPTVVYFGLYRMFLRLGIGDTLMGVIISHAVSTLPYMVWACRLSYESVVRQYEPLLRSMALPLRQRVFRVLFPLMASGVATGTMLAMMISLCQYLPTLIIGGGVIRSLTGVMFPYILGGDIRTGAVYTIIFIMVSFMTMRMVDAFMRIVVQEDTCQN